MTPDSQALLARGLAQFTGDLPLPAGGLHAAVAVSPLAHAAFGRVETTAACAEPGVVAVLTAADIPGLNDIGNLFHDEPLLADKVVVCVGQPYALVIAESAEAARRGAQRVSADWEPRPALFDAREAFAAGALIQPPRTFALGRPDEVWSRCHAVVAGRVEIGSAEHVYLETQCALALPRDDGGLHVHSATQSPSVVQKAVAAVTGLPMHRVEIEVARLGGGFGGKEDQATLWACLAALAAWKLKRPVRIRPDRREDMRITGKRHPYSADYRLGVDADGRFLAYEAFLYQNAGCSADLSTAILERSLFHAASAYFIPNVRVTAASCRTNLPSNTAFRGFGAPQAVFVLEAAIREAARALQLSPHVLQQRNLLRDGDTLPYGMQPDRVRARACWQALENRFRPEEHRRDIEAWNAVNPRYRRGMALIPVCFGIGFTATLLNQAEALAHVYADGSVSVTTGAVEMGQGVHDKIRAVVAHTLGLTRDRIHVETTSTLRVANVSPTAASTGADLNGEAAHQACLTIRRGLAPVAASMLGVPVESVTFAENWISTADQELALSWESLVAEAYARRVSLSALAHYATPGLSFNHASNTGKPFAYHVYGAALIEGTVDALRGTGRIDRVSVVHDCGQSLDEQTDRGQIEGAVVQGIGWMTSEDIRHDAQGRLLSDSLASYKIPDLRSAPEMDVVLLEDADNPPGVLNSKAVGEPPLIYGLGAYFALLDAMSSLRPDVRPEYRTPMSSERIFTWLYPDEPV
ncbi:xanthine dehydrogenase large subunit [Fluviicoccus keumensis]|uniref:Xanthine dehydrogenase large subunit n=1 Tax=Fluviicoccus keumensis TaxID=1435465 RepID=A0A4Q7Z602_9GAMM|nr:molybdopterin cofactor-binding domain-containing protein [Fluviicoccus keumensis]RZU45115.1 xanthine dehydrogenase large subunit [Fluviicoccus keumensis]